MCKSIILLLVRTVCIICVVVINVEGYVLHCVIPFETLRLSRTLLYSLPDKPHDQRQSQLLYRVPKTSAISISSYFSKWLDDQTDWMSSIDTHVSLDGLRFTFRASPGSYLQISIGSCNKKRIASDEAYLDITADLFIQSKDEKVKTLISFAVDNIINSFTQGLAELSNTLLVSHGEVAPNRESISSVQHDIKDDKSVLKAYDLIQFTGIGQKQDMINFIHEWSTKFAGVGIEATRQPDGVSFSFLVAPEYKLNFRIDGESHDIVYTELIMDNRLAVGSDTEHRVLIDKAANGIVKDLKSNVINRTPGGRNTFLPKSPKSSSSTRNSKAVSFADGTSSSTMRTAETGKDFVPQNVKTNIPSIPNDDIGSIIESTKAVKAATAEVVTADSYVRSLKKVNPSVTVGSQSNNIKSQPQWQPYLDPKLKERAKEAGVRLEKFSSSDLSEQSLNEFNKMLDETKKQGIFSYFESLSKDPILVSIDDNSGQESTGNKADGKISQPTTKTISLNELFDVGSSEILSGKITSMSPSAINNDPSTAPSSSSTSASSSPSTLSKTVKPTPLPVSAASAQDEKRLMLLMNELNKSLPERHDDIILAFEDLLLSDNILALLKTKSEEALSMDIRLLYGKITTKAAEMWNTYANLIAEESVRHLEIVLNVCQVSRDFQHDPLAFADEMDRIKPKFDTTLLSYLRYAIKEEESIIRLKGIEPTTAPSAWLQVLLIVRNGVAYELEERFQRVIEPLIYILRFDQIELRSQLFFRLVQSTPTLDLPYLRTCAENMVDYTLTNHLDADPGLIDKMKLLANDIGKFLSDEILQNRIDEFKNEARQQGSELIVTNRSQRQSGEDSNDSIGNDNSSISSLSSVRKKWIGSSMIDTAGDFNGSQES